MAGLLVGVLAGWLSLLSPASSVIASIANIGFSFLMLSVGIALLRCRSQVDEATQASAQAPS
jgi:XapX domain-containing protein